MSLLAEIIYIFLQMLAFAIFLRVILSWFVMGSRSAFLINTYQVLHQLTEPILSPLRRIIPNIGMFDITPIVAFILLQVIGDLIIRFLG
ncbi:MAG: YggT family protein [Chloroflexota bacterium]|nr:YggT family protein [Chloroflexota bacterium]